MSTEQEKQKDLAQQAEEQQQVQKSTERAEPMLHEKRFQESEKRIQASSHHSLNELLQVAIDMGDQRVIDAIMKKMNE